MPDRDNTLLVARARNLDELRAALNRRREMLHMAMLELDNAAGLQDGYSAKVLCGQKGLGPVSLGRMLSALGVEMHLVAGSAAAGNGRNHETLGDVFKKKPDALFGKERRLGAQREDERAGVEGFLFGGRAGQRPRPRKAGAEGEAIPKSDRRQEAAARAR